VCGFRHQGDSVGLVDPILGDGPLWNRDVFPPFIRSS